MILDDQERIRSVDSQDMFSVLSKFNDQLLEAQHIVQQTDLPRHYNIQHCLVAGMGGSAISGELLSQYTEEKGFIPVSVIRKYHLPKWINKQTLVFAQSYSGDTEETLSAFKHAFEKKCPIISITSNGRLSELSQHRSIPCIIIPSGFQPRAALPYLFFSSLFALQKIGLFKSIIDKEIQETKEVISLLIQKVSPEIPTEENLAKQIASTLHETFPQIYGWHLYESVAQRWAKQINENAKMISGYHMVPESNHNDIVGWSEHSAMAKQCSTIIFRDAQNESLKMKTRLDFMRTFYGQVSKQVMEVAVIGKTPLAKMMYLVLLGDYVSCYLAVLQGKDPTPVSIINQLKETLDRL